MLCFSPSSWISNLSLLSNENSFSLITWILLFWSKALQKHKILNMVIFMINFLIYSWLHTVTHSYQQFLFSVISHTYALKTWGKKTIHNNFTPHLIIIINSTIYPLPGATPFSQSTPIKMKRASLESWEKEKADVVLIGDAPPSACLRIFAIFSLPPLL